MGLSQNPERFIHLFFMDINEHRLLAAKISSIGVILVDFKKDFVLIDHRIILGKVRELAIPREIFPIGR